jgi:membrane protein DedA with SNARE-associated domain
VANLLSIIFKGIGIFVGIVLLLLGGWIGVENWQAPGIINLPIMVFSVAAILTGGLLLWLAFRKYEKK